MPADEGLGKAKLAAKGANLVLEEFAQRLDELHVHALGQAADVVMRLDRYGWAACERHAFDHVGIERALRQEFGAADFLRFVLEDVDEILADHLALCLGFRNARQRIEKALGSVNVDERNVVVIAEKADDFVRFAEPHQPVIDEHAGQLIADRLVNEHGRDGAIDAA